MPLGINLGSQAYVNFDTAGTVNTQVIGLGYGTLNTIGTLPNIPGGSIVMTTGTLATLPNLPQGSIQVTAGTIATLGTLGTVGTILGLGTLAGAGTITNIGVINNAGTLQLGTIVGNIASGASDSSNPVKVGGVYNSTLPTLTTGQRGDVQLDAKAIAMVNNAYKLDNVNDTVTAYPLGHSFLNIVAGQATTTVKSGAGVLHAIVFNTTATATSTMVIYDNTAASGTFIGSITATALLAPLTVIYDIAFATGLTIITATANGSNMTVIYR